MYASNHQSAQIRGYFAPYVTVGVGRLNSYSLPQGARIGIVIRIHWVQRDQSDSTIPDDNLLDHSYRRLRCYRSDSWKLFRTFALRNIVLDLLVQCDAPTPIFPWTVLTAVFLHASILHIASNVFFLIFFGFILEEQVSKFALVTTFFITGLVGSLGFVGYDVLGYLLSGETR